MLVFNFDLIISRPKKIEFLLKQSSTWHRSVYDWPFPVCVEQACQRLTFSSVQAETHSSVWNMARCVSLCSIWLFQAGTHRKGIHLLLLHLFRYDRLRQLTTQFRKEYICLCYTFSGITAARAANDTFFGRTVAGRDALLCVQQVLKDCCSNFRPGWCLDLSGFCLLVFQDLFVVFFTLLISFTVRCFESLAKQNECLILIWF